MVIGLLTLAAIPSTIAIAEGISEQKNRNNAKKDEKRLRKFHLSCWCEGKSPGKSDVHQGMIVVGDEKVCHTSRCCPAFIRVMDRLTCSGLGSISEEETKAPFPPF